MKTYRRLSHSSQLHLVSAFLSKILDVGDLLVLTFGNCALKAEWLSGLWNYTNVFFCFLTFFSKSNDFCVFLSCCTRFLEHCPCGRPWLTKGNCFFYSLFRPSRHYWHQYIQETTQQCTFRPCAYQWLHQAVKQTTSFVSHLLALPSPRDACLQMLGYLELLIYHSVI